MTQLDLWIADLARGLARRTSRRSFLASLGRLLAGGAVLPLLPVSRARAAEPDRAEPEGDPDACAYWRYCSIDGFLSSCCGGSSSGQNWLCVIIESTVPPPTMAACSEQRSG